MKRAVVLDMDGVLVDSELYWKKVEFAFLNGLAPDFDMNGHIGLLGMSVPDVFRLFKERFHIAMEKDEFVRMYDEMAVDIYRNKCSLTPGCVDALLLLRKSGFLIALATSSSRKWVDVVFGRFVELDGVFDVVTSADDVNGKKKPDPAIYLQTAKSLTISPGSCVAVEDSGNGILSAKRAGMKCIGYRNGFNDEQDLSKADFVMQRGFGELTAEKLNAMLER